MQYPSLDQLSFQALSAALQTSFRLRVDDSRVMELRLVEAVRRPDACPARPSPSPAKFECFSLLFAGPREPLLAQRTYLFQHEQIGEFQLFIVPVGVTATNAQYEVVFNRLLATDSDRRGGSTS